MTGSTSAEVHGRSWARAPWWAIAAVVALVLGLVTWLSARAMLKPEFKYPVPWFIVRWMLWVPVVGALGRPVQRLVSARARPAVLVGALLAGFLAVTTYLSLALAGLSRFMGPPSYEKLGFWRMVFNGLKNVEPAITYLGIIGILGTIELRRRLRQEALHSARLEAELTRAELDQMRVQLHPQLIEDTLRTTAEFVRAGASTQAVQLLARLSDVLRLTLATLGQERVSLRQEMEFLQAYLGLQQIRAPGRLRSRVDIRAEALTAEVPSLALFQLAELPATPWEGALELSASVEDGRLRGPPASARRRTAGRGGHRGHRPAGTPSPAARSPLCPGSRPPRGPRECGPALHPGDPAGASRLPRALPGGASRHGALRPRPGGSPGAGRYRNSRCSSPTGIAFQAVPQPSVFGY